MKKLIFVLIVVSTISFLYSKTINFTNNWNKEGLNLINVSETELIIEYSVHEIGLEEVKINGKTMMQPILAGSLLPNNEGMPDLPGYGRFFAVPNNANIKLEILSTRKEIINNIDIAPAPRIPLDSETGPLMYSQNNEVYTSNSFYPQTPIQLSEITEIRGVKAAILGITPFQYNPVTKDLVIFKDIRIRISFKGGSGEFGEDRLRSIWWDPILSDIFLNYDSLPKINYSYSTSRTEDYEYIIITPDDPIFIEWADSLSVFRNEQGIHTGVVTTTEIGGNTVTAIQNYINNAYFNWDISPSAVLLLGDYGTTGNSIVSPIWNNYCVSDNIFADVTNNSMPDVILARITAQDEDHLSTMIGKILDYERNPSTNPDFYDHPVTALGWQTERWFQICSESVGGFWHNELGKDQVRINAIYSGNPAVDPWSTATNTYTVLNVFGPNGQGYIPASPSELGGWTGGSAVAVNNAINSGAFMLQHRDHGGVTGWGEPNYDIGDLDGLNNDDLVFVFSINCLTGKFNANETCFAEAFHRHEKGALGIIAASEVSYSFVNDTFVWGMYDHLWPDFLPSYETTPEHRGILPAFANAAGKYFLQQSSWPYNTNNKEVTYNLFHHHGGAFSTVHSEMPQQLTVEHADELMAGSESFYVTADEGALIGLSVNSELLASALGTGAPLEITIPQQNPNNTMKITVTKQNHYRYSADVVIISPDMYVICYDVDYVELGIHAEGSYQSLDTLQIDLTLQNIGVQPTGSTVTAILTTESDKINIINDIMNGAQIPASSFMTYTDAFTIELLPLIEDNSIIEFEIEITSDGNTWISGFELNCNAPILEYSNSTINILNGTDQILDPGEQGEIFLSFHNIGNGYAYDSEVQLSTSDPNVTLSGFDIIASIAPDSIEITTIPFIVEVAENSPVEYFAEIDVYIVDSSEFPFQSMFRLPIGFYAYDFEYGDEGWEQVILSEGYINEWHLEDFRNNTIDGDFSMKCGGVGELFYSTYIHAALVMPEIEVFPGALVTFYHWMDVGPENTPNTWDGGLIEISVNGGEWEQVEPVDGYPSTIINIPSSPFEEGTPVFAGNIDWELVELDLSAYSGTAQIRFVFGSASLFTGEGWYIDDIHYSNTTGSNNDTIIPITNQLYSNFPNPFNPTTTISFDIAQASSFVTLDIYNIKGQKVKTLVNDDLEVGKHTILWNGKDDGGKLVSSGIYFYKMKTAKYTSTRKMILMK